MDQEEGCDIPFPTFFGNQMPLNVSIDHDNDISEETTRRVAGFTYFPTDSLMSLIFDNKTVVSCPVKAVSATKSSSWSVPEAPAVPDFCPLEQSSVFCPHTSAQNVADRVAAILSELHVPVQFRENKAECITDVEFEVNLYRGKNEYSHGTICEVQRLFGNVPSFYRLASPILDAAQGKKQVATFDELPLPGSGPVTPPSLDFVRKMLPNTDTLVLALQTLISMTDGTKVGEATAFATCHSLLQENRDVFAKVLEFFASNEGEASTAIQALMLLSNVIATTCTTTKETHVALEHQLHSKHPQVKYFARNCLEISTNFNGESLSTER
jgi:hypothetical protein